MFKIYKLFLLLFFVFLIFCSGCANTNSQISEIEGQPIDQNIEENNKTEDSQIDFSEKIKKIEIIETFPDLIFERPLEFQMLVVGDEKRIFIVEQKGKIFIIDKQKPSDSKLFLDITDKVDDNSNEKGLLGLAFHPNFDKNREFYLNYTTENETIISRFNLVAEEGFNVDRQSEEIIMRFGQPYSNHNGGKIAFGPDGFLYISTGDGGSAGDPNGNGQSLNTFLGKILRIDINNKDEGLGYSIPQDNPFKNNNEGFLEEIYAYGLRNPWRFSFDSETDKLWAGDVGQDKIEEIDIIENGGNYGWNIMEGSQCYDPPNGCEKEGLILPVYEYDHSLGKSITGGFVYRGEKLPFLKGVYVYADFVSGKIWGFKGNKNYTIKDSGLNISSFGVDDEQELYFTAFDGKIYNFYFP